ncbi:peroxide stress protein YaaA [Sneathiella sp.]|uniref:peroxide stress protein YaaA n=1 Tax=Sneathiella sp. TaxID=1964365 RepID=UPI0035627537
MLAIISPAKKLNFERDNSPELSTQPEFLPETKKLIARAKKLNAKDLQRLMKISDDLSALNRERFKAMKLPLTPDNAKQAAFAFNGDTYTGLQAPTMTAADIDYAQDHLRILSGLYGLVRPLDLIQPYRLEMGTRLDTERGDNLYQFWGDRLSRKLDAELNAHGSPVLINLASSEYFKAVDRKSLKATVITPIFKEIRGNTAKVIGFTAKRARGMMARFMIENRIDRPDGLKEFGQAGYLFQPTLSDAHNYIFTRAAT